MTEKRNELIMLNYYNRVNMFVVVSYDTVMENPSFDEDYDSDPEHNPFLWHHIIIDNSSSPLLTTKPSDIILKGCV